MICASGRRNAVCFPVLLLLALAAPLLHGTVAAQSDDSLVAFESGQVRPLALSPNGRLLFAVNTPDNRLEIFRVNGPNLRPLHSVSVGLEPVAVAARSNDEVWVVNHLSDSVSVVRLNGPRPPQVVRTLNVGDEPRDIVFAGAQRDRAFVTTAHRGQNSPLPYEPFESQGRADVWVFEAASTQDEPLTILTLFGDTPRPLAVSADGRTVYAGILHSGNRTSVIPNETARNRPVPPFENVEGEPAPPQALIVREEGGRWVDAGGQDWTATVRVELPDYDVFAIDAAAPQPVEIDRFSGVGTTLFNIAVDPASGRLYVSNLEARNHVRFEGEGELSDGETLRGHFVENRITVVDPVSGDVRPRHLNKHIDYARFPGTQAENDASLATPLEMVFTPDGEYLFVAAFGSSKIGRFETARLYDDTFTPSPANHIELPGGGPSGLVMDAQGGWLYVLTRFDNAVSVIDVDSLQVVDTAAMFNPEPARVVAGRQFLYDARLTSSRGDSSCAGCHIFGDVDQLAWNLGDPDLPVEENPNPPRPGAPGVRDFHPLKGPMTTQSLRGMDTHGPMHWRGDRTGGNDPESEDPFDERAAFRAFNVAFEALLGRTAPLTDEQMEAFTDFALSLTYPPNPVRALDDGLTQRQLIGRDVYFNRIGRQGLPCNGCHVLAPEEGFFGTSGLTSGNEQPMKVPHLRNLYTKVGFIGRATDQLPPAGPQIRGFGYSSEGSIDTLPNFLRGFDENFSPGARGRLEREGMVSFLLAFESNLKPIVGQQVTVDAAADAATLERLDLLRARAGARDCSLVAKGARPDGRAFGALMVTDGLFLTDRRGVTLDWQQLLDLAQGGAGPVTYTCVPVGSGRRIGVDRDLDGVFDGDEGSLRGPLGASRAGL